MSPTRTLARSRTESVSAASARSARPQSFRRKLWSAPHRRQFARQSSSARRGGGLVSARVSSTRQQILARAPARRCARNARTRRAGRIAVEVPSHRTDHLAPRPIDVTATVPSRPAIEAQHERRRATVPLVLAAGRQSSQGSTIASRYDSSRTVRRVSVRSLSIRHQPQTGSYGCSRHDRQAWRCPRERA